MAKFKLVPYSFRIYKKGDRTNSINLNNLELGNGCDDFLDYIHHYLENENKSHIFEKYKKTISIIKVSKSERIISGIAKYGEYGLEGSFRDTMTKDEITNIKREQHYSEEYPFFFLFYIPEDRNKGIAIFQTFRNFGIKTILEKVLNNLLDSNGLAIELHHIISRNLLDKINKSRLVEFHMIRYEVPMDVAETFNANNPDDIHEIHSIIANRNKDIEIAQRIKDLLSENETKYYEVLGEQYDEIKVLIKVGGEPMTLTFDNNNNRYRESLKFKPNIPLDGGFPSYTYLLDCATNYLKHIEDI